MYFVQFEQPPNVVTHHTIDVRTIETTIAIVTRPNRFIYNEDVTLRASLVSLNDDDSPFLTTLHQWHAGMSSLQIEFDVTWMGIACPVRVHISAEDQDNDGLALHTQASRVFLALSSCFDCTNPSTSPEKVERRFKLSNKRELRTVEDDSCPFNQNAKQLKSSGAALLSYIDSIIGLRTDGIPELVRKFALATSKTLKVVDMSQNCGAVGIAIGQLIPGSSAVVLDDIDSMPIIEENVRSMYPAISAAVTFRDWNSDEASEGVGRAVDIIFTSPFSEGGSTSCQAAKVLKSLLERSPRAVVVYVEAEELVPEGKNMEERDVKSMDPEGQDEVVQKLKDGHGKEEALKGGNEDHGTERGEDGENEESGQSAGVGQREDIEHQESDDVMQSVGVGQKEDAENQEDDGVKKENEAHQGDKTYTISDVMSQYGKALCGNERISGGSVFTQYRVMVFRGRRRR